MIASGRFGGAHFGRRPTWGFAQQRRSASTSLRWRAFAIALFVIQASALVGCERSRSEPPGDIILITVDTLRPDHLGIYGHARATSPNLDQWFAEGTVFERSYSTEASTPPSVASILSGLLPQEHRVRLFYQLLPDSTPILPDLLPDTYQTAGFVSNMVLTEEALGLSVRFDHFDDYVDQREPYRKVFERSARATTDAVLAWLASGRDADRPLFLWVHYNDPHAPYHPPDDWTFSFEHEEPRPIDIERVPRYQREPGITDGLTYVDRYDEEIAYFDTHLGRLLDHLEKTETDETSLFLFSADHGESMMEHEHWFAHGYHVYEEIIRVPLLIRGPGVEAGRNPIPTSGLDLAPTILAFANAETPDRMRGVDLREPLPASRPIFSEASSFVGGGRHAAQWRAVVRGQEKWIARVPMGRRKIRAMRYYDLASDPGEEKILEWPDDGRSVPQAFLALIRDDPDPGGRPESQASGFAITAPKVNPNVTQDQLERLRALGYVE